MTIFRRESMVIGSLGNNNIDDNNDINDINDNNDIYAKLNLDGTVIASWFYSSSPQPPPVNIVRN